MIFCSNEQNLQACSFETKEIHRRMISRIRTQWSWKTKGDFPIKKKEKEETM